MYFVQYDFFCRLMHLSSQSASVRALPFMEGVVYMRSEFLHARQCIRRDATHVTISGTVIGRDIELLLLLASKFFGGGRQFITCQLV